MFASLQIVKPRAIIPENLSPEKVTYVFNLEKFVQRMGKVRVDVGIVRGDDDIVVANTADHVADEILVRVYHGDDICVGMAEEFVRHLILFWSCWRVKAQCDSKLLNFRPKQIVVAVVDSFAVDRLGTHG